MKVYTLPLGLVQTNCHIIATESKDCIVIDPGGQGKMLVDYIEEQKLKPIGILLTHAHFDHIGAIDDVVDKWDIPVYVHKKEMKWLTDPTLNGSKLFQLPDVIVKTIPQQIIAEEGFTLGEFSFQVYHTPGHSPGSVSYYMETEKAIFSGDVLFQMSVGRTDLPGGDSDTLQNSIHTKLYQLPDETIVYCGHGMQTTIGSEKRNNPFVQ